LVGREPDEWIGATPDTAIPPRVRLRVLERFGRRDYDTGRPIGPADKWDADHLVALVNGGENRESNLVPRLKDKHKEKTRKDVAQKSYNAKVIGRHYGVKAKARKIPSRPLGRQPSNTKYINDDMED